jgi:T5SS/PEP-CTERM-associated repeat protein
MRLYKPFVIGVTLMAMSMGRPLPAVTVKWNTFSGSFYTSSNWTDVSNSANHVVPQVNDTAIFDHTDFASHSIAMPGRPIATPVTRHVKQMKFGLGNYRFYDSVSYSTQLPAIFSIDETDSLGEGALTIGEASGDRGYVVSELVELNAASVILGKDLRSEGSLTIAASTLATMNISGAQASYPLTVGYNGSGQLGLSGHLNVAGDVAVGRNASATGRVTLAVGAQMIAKKLLIGMAGHGTLFVQSHSNLFCDELTISGLYSDAYVRGNDYGIGSSTIAASGAIHVGKAGEGLFGVVEGGWATSAGATIGADNGFGRAYIEGDGSQWTNNGDLGVGTTGTGALYVNDGGNMIVAGLASVGADGLIGGNGKLTGNFSNGGVFAPGNSFVATLGSLGIVGNYTQSPAGALQIDLGGTTPDADYDQLLVSGSVTVGGTLNVSLGGSFTPQGGEVFNILDFGNLSGVFDNVILPDLSEPLKWDTSKLYSDGVLSVVLPGDYNNDNIINAADYTVWRDTLGSTTDLRADGSGSIAGVPDGVIDGFDYDLWKANFGTMAGQGSGADAELSTIARNAVPEPSGLLLLTVASLSLIPARDRRNFVP